MFKTFATYFQFPFNKFADSNFAEYYDPNYRMQHIEGWGNKDFERN